MKAAFGQSWKKAVCDLVKGKFDPVSPAVLVIATSCIRVISVLKFEKFSRTYQ